MRKKIAIIGSGIAGLTLANLLKKNPNFDFLLFEKEDFLNLEEGYGIQLSINSISILNKIGFDQLNENEKYCPAKLDFYSINYEKICDLDLSIFNTPEKKYTTLRRSILISFLKKNLSTSSITFGKKVKNVDHKENKINIFFTDGTTESADYLVVSDGIFSETKSIIEKKTFKPIFLGALAIRTEIQNTNISHLNDNNITLMMGSNAHLVLYPINQKKELNLVCIIRRDIEYPDSIKEILENTILKTNKNLINFFKGNLKSWPIYVSSKPIKSIHKNVFYIGDSFYTFSPTLAQGASQAIESANEISELINKEYSDISGQYFKHRKYKTSLISKRSKFNYFAFHISNPILKILRNFFLKNLVKNKSFIQSYIGKIYR